MKTLKKSIQIALSLAIGSTIVACGGKSTTSSAEKQKKAVKITQSRQEWSALLGTATDDKARGVSVDASGNIYVAGYSKGNFDNKKNSGNYDMFFVKYSSAGDKQWSALLGTTTDDKARGVSVDASGNIYVAGYSKGNFDNKKNSGNYDMFVVKYNSAGNKQWSALLGTATDDKAKGVNVDANGNIYVVGYSEGNFDNKSNSGREDMFVVKYSSAGDKQWSALLGTTANDRATEVSVDANGNVYVAGYSEGNFDNKSNAGGDDMFVVKYNSAGSKQWSALLGTATHDRAEGVSVDASGNVYVAGYSEGNFDNKRNLGNNDMFVVKYNSVGDKQWSALLGSSDYDKATGVSVDANSNVYVAGFSFGNFAGKTNAGGQDMFVVKYNSEGDKQWSELLGTAADDGATGVSVDVGGNVYVAGGSAGNFAGKTNAGDFDMFVVKFGRDNANQAPIAPQSVQTGNITSSSIQISWSAATDADGTIAGYAVSYKAGGDSWASAVSKSNNSRTHTFSGLQDNRSYTFRVRAKDDDGAWSAWQVSTAVMTAVNSSQSRKKWSALLGSSADDKATGVSVDAGSNVYVVGSSAGNFDSKSNLGREDMFLVKYNTASGEKQWSALLGTANLDYATGVSVDAGSNVYVAGYSAGNFDNNSNVRYTDMLLVKYNATGDKQWSALLGTANLDYATGVSVDTNGNVYVVGHSGGNFDNKSNSGDYDIFLVKYNSAGDKQWSALFGTAAADEAAGVSIDASGNVYVVGSSAGNFDGKSNAGSQDMFLVKYNSMGGKQWSVLLGTAAADKATGVSIDTSGNVYVAGYSAGNFDGKSNAGLYDMFLVKYNSTGNKQWSALLGTANWDEATGVSVDASGNVYVAGYSAGNFDSKSNAGNFDMFVVKYNTTGDKQWSALFGTAVADKAAGVSVDVSDNVYVAGYSTGSFDGKSNSGDADMFVVKLGK